MLELRCWNILGDNWQHEQYFMHRLHRGILRLCGLKCSMQYLRDQHLLPEHGKRVRIVVPCGLLPRHHHF